MPFDLYSKRNKPMPDVFVYEPIPPNFRQQVKFLIEDFFGDSDISENEQREYYKLPYRILTREYGVYQLNKTSYADHYNDQIFGLLLTSNETDKIIDVIEWLFKVASGFQSSRDHTFSEQKVIEKNYTDTINELNYRFRENALGYRFDVNEKIIIKADNELLHQQIVQPLIYYITSKEFSTINEEYFKAHEHFRHGRNKECLNDCLKAFESTMKIICAKKGYTFDQKDTSSTLIKILYDNNFIPSYLKTKVGGLRSTLESGIPTIRNRNSGHGQGTNPITVNDNLASYCLNLTGSTIKFLIELLNHSSPAE